MANSIFFIILGLVLLYFGAEGLVRGSVALALKLGLTPLVIGLTIVAFGTSSPEMAVSIRAAMAGSGDIALGNVVGSNICNIALILGICSLIRPLQVQLQVVRIEIPIMIGVSVVLTLLLLIFGQIGFLTGLPLFLGIITYTVFSLVIARKQARKNMPVEPDTTRVQKRTALWLDIVFIITGLGLLVAGGHSLVSGAVRLALAVGVSEAVIGLTIVAIGTSLPELATSLVAALKGESDLAVGNIIGSSIFNILAIVGLTGLIRPITMVAINWIDLAVMVGVALLSLPLMRTGFRLDRVEGGLLLLIYTGYLVWLIH